MRVSFEEVRPQRRAVDFSSRRSLDLDGALGSDAGLPVDPLPHEPLRDTEKSGGGGLAVLIDVFVESHA